MTYASEVLADSPLVYFKQDETTGNPIDSSTNARTGQTYGGTVTRGATSLLSDHSGAAVTYDGATACLSVPYASWMNQTSFSVEIIFKPTNVTGNHVLASRYDATGDTWFLRQTDAGLQFWLEGSDFNWNLLSQSAAVAVGVKHHVICTFGGGAMRMYLDGVLVQSQTGVPPIQVTTCAMRIGAGMMGGFNDPFAGTLDEFSFYGTALSQARVTAHYAAATAAPPTTGTLTAALASPRAAVSGTVTTPVTPVTGTVAASLAGPTAAFSGTVTGGATGSPATGTVAASLAGPTAALSGTVTGGDTGSGSVLSGAGGSLVIDFSATTSKTLTFTPTFAGSLVVQAAGWQASYTVTDSDGDVTQEDTGALGVIWVAGELMHITIAPVAGQPLVPVTFTWSYAARASSPLSISLDNDEVLETPGGLGIDIYNGQPSDSVTLSILGPAAVADFQTTTLDTFGVREDLMVRLPALAAGDYFLRVEGDVSGSEDTPFTVLNDALSQADATRVDDTAPLRDPALHWRLFDLRDHAQNYTFVRNPSSWTNVYPPNDFTHDKTTAVDGQPLTWQAAARPWRMEFTGWLDTEGEYNDLLFWSQLRRRLWLVDHRNRAWLITIEQFDAQAQVKPNLPWAHKYTVKTLVFMQG